MLNLVTDLIMNPRNFHLQGSDVRNVWFCGRYTEIFRWICLLSYLSIGNLCWHCIYELHWQTDFINMPKNLSWDSDGRNKFFSLFLWSRRNKRPQFSLPWGMFSSGTCFPWWVRKQVKLVPEIVWQVRMFYLRRGEREK